MPRRLVAVPLDADFTVKPGKPPFAVGRRAVDTGGAMGDSAHTIGRQVDPEGAAAALRSGEVVLLPLDTVYALAADATSAPARNRLLAAAGLTDNHPGALSWHAASASVIRSAFDAAGVRLSDRAQSVIDALLPGPVTLEVGFSEADARRVLETLAAPAGLMDVEGRLLVRAPDHPVARAVLERVSEPVVMAALPGETLVRTINDATLSLLAHGDADSVAAVCDGAPQPVGRLSTHVRLEPDGSYDVTREGPVSAGEVRRRVGRLLLFVCTGNTCRSPMAVALAKKLIAQRGLPGIGRVSVLSGGVYAGRGAPATQEAQLAVKARGADLTEHASAPLDRSMLERADAIFVMTRGHLDALAAEAPDAAKRATLLDPDGRDIPDPLGGPPELYDRTAAQIERLLERRLTDAGIIGGDGANDQQNSPPRSDDGANSEGDAS